MNPLKFSEALVPSEGTSLHEITLFDIRIVEIGLDVFAGRADWKQTKIRTLSVYMLIL
jgi:hypothetical protein